MMAEEPSYTALATSEISARVGRGFWIMLSSISVAVITRLPSMRHLLIRYFCRAGTSMKGISTPRSPRATMMPSATSQISSTLSTPLRFSILAMMSMSLPPLAFSRSRMACTSDLEDTKEAATKSTPFSMPKSRSFLSCSDRKSCFSTLPGKFMLFRSDRTPPFCTRQMTSLPLTSSTFMMTSPLLISTVSPGNSSFVRLA